MDLPKRKQIRLPDYDYSAPDSSKAIHALFSDLTVWQRSYHEHVIRGEDDYRMIWDYIDTNPARWAEDRYFTT